MELSTVVVDKLFLLWTLFRSKNYQMFALTLVTTMVQLMPKIRKMYKRFKYPVTSNTFFLKTDDDSIDEIIGIETDLGKIDVYTLGRDDIRRFINTYMIRYTTISVNKLDLDSPIRFKDKFKIIYRHGYAKQWVSIQSQETTTFMKFCSKNIEYFNKVTMPINKVNDSISYYKANSRNGVFSKLESILFCPELFTCHGEISKLVNNWKTQEHKRKLLGGGKLSLVFEGLPGCGKTLLAKHMAYLTGSKSVHEGVYDGKNKCVSYVNNSDKKCVIVFDDIDILWAYDRESDNQNNEIERSKAEALMAFMKFLDDADSNQIIIFTTNFYDRFDKALFRKGRVDARIRFGELPFENCKQFAIKWYNGFYDNYSDQSDQNDQIDFHDDRFDSMVVKSATAAVLVSAVKNNIDSVEAFLNNWNAN